MALTLRDEDELERLLDEERRSGRFAFDVDRDRDYTPSEDELRWLDHEDIREDNERNDLPSDEYAPFDPEESPDSSKGGSLPKGDEPVEASPEEVVDSYFSTLDDRPGMTSVPDMTVTEDDIDAYNATSDALGRLPGADDPGYDTLLGDSPGADMVLSPDDVEALSATERLLGRLPPAGDAYATNLGDELPPVTEPVDMDFTSDRNPGTEDMDMREWQNLPNDLEPDIADLAMAPDDISDEDLGTTGSEVLPADVSTEARELLGMTGPRPGVDTDLINPFTDEELFANADAADERYAARDREGWSPLSGRASGELMPEEVAFGETHPEPDADEAGGHPDGDADDWAPLEVPRYAGPSLDWESEPDADEAGGMPDLDGDDAEPVPTDMPTPDPVGDDEEMVASALDRVTKSTPYDRPLEQPDFTAADWSDAIRRPLHAIGAGLLASSGRGRASPFRSDREAMEARLRARDEAKGSATTAMRETDAERSRWDADRASRERIAAERDARIAEHDRAMEEIGRSRADVSSTRADAYVSDVGSRVARRDVDTARITDNDDPRSEASIAARENLMAEITLLPEPTHSAATAAFNERELSATEVEHIRRDIERFARPYLGRVRAGGGGGGAGLQALRAEAVRMGLPESSAAVMDGRGLRDFIDENTGREVGSVEEILIPGVPLSEVHTDMAPAETARMRNYFYSAADGLAALNEVERIYNEYGASTVITPELWAELEGPMGRLRAMVAAVNNLGVIQPGERALVDASLPDASSATGMALGRLTGSLRGWRDTVRSSVATRLRGTGASPGAVSAGMEYVETAGDTSGFGGGIDASGEEALMEAGGSVTMTDADGNVYDVPADMVAEAESAGLRRSR